MTNDTTATEDVKSDATTTNSGKDTTSATTTKETTSATGTPATNQTGSSNSGSSAINTATTTISGSSTGVSTSSTTDTTGSSLSTPTEPTPEEQFPQRKYIKPVHPEILASKAFKASELEPPRPYYYYPNVNDGTDEQDYQWVEWSPKDGDTMYQMWLKYRVSVADWRAWNPQSWACSYARYGGQHYILRIKASLLPHD